MKRIYVAIIGAILIVIMAAGGYWAWHHRVKAPQGQSTGPVYAYADVEHIMMSHPGYSKYHRLELEYNAMIAQYQFEQWDYSHKAVQQRNVIPSGDSDTGLVMAAALEQELQARIELKKNDLTAGLKQRAEAMLKEKKKMQQDPLNENDLKIVNLQLQLSALSMTAEERKSSQEKLQGLLRAQGKTQTESEQAVQEVTEAMIPYKQKAQKELADYTNQIRQEIQMRQKDSHALFQQQPFTGNMAIPEPAVWNQEWKEKLTSKEKELKDTKEAIMADIRDKAAVVAQDQGIDMIFSDYLGYGTALDVTDDIIVKLA